MIHAELDRICVDAAAMDDRLSKTILSRFSELILRYIADFVAFDLVEDDGSITRSLTCLFDPEKEITAQLLRETLPLSITSAYGYPRVIKTGKSQFMPWVSPRIANLLMPGTPEQKANSGLVARSYLCTPLIAHGRTLGAMTLATIEDRRPDSSLRLTSFTSDDLLLMEEIAEKLALCIDR